MRDSYIRIRISTQDKEKLKEMADERSMNISQFINYLIQKEEIKKELEKEK